MNPRNVCVKAVKSDGADGSGRCGEDFCVLRQKDDIREIRSGLCLKVCSFCSPWFIQKESESGHGASSV